MAYRIDDLPLDKLIGPVARATEALVRLDERLARSPVRDSWIERQHFADACAALWLEGELVHVEDLVLHDAHMDIRTPTHELTRAHGVLRARRQIFGQKPDWALSPEGLRTLTRRGRAGDPVAHQKTHGRPEPESREGDANDQGPSGFDADGVLDKALKSMDAVLERSAKLIEGQREGPPPERVVSRERPELVYDPDRDEEARLDGWLGVMAETKALPAVLRCAILIEAWDTIDVLQHASWLGSLLVSSLLRQDGLALHHLPSWNVGARQIPRERRRAVDRTERLLACVAVVGEAAAQGLKEHDRLMLARGQMERRLDGRRTSSRLPELIDLVLSRPLVSSGMIQQALKVSKQGALNLVGDLGLREMTGRGRFRAWGVI